MPTTAFSSDQPPWKSSLTIDQFVDTNEQVELDRVTNQYSEKDIRELHLPTKEELKAAYAEYKLARQHNNVLHREALEQLGLVATNPGWKKKLLGERASLYKDGKDFRDKQSSIYLDMKKRLDQPEILREYPRLLIKIEIAFDRAFLRDPPPSVEN